MKFSNVREFKKKCIKTNKWVKSNTIRLQNNIPFSGSCSCSIKDKMVNKYMLLCFRTLSSSYCAIRSKAAPYIREGCNQTLFLKLLLFEITRIIINLTAYANSEIRIFFFSSPLCDRLCFHTNIPDKGNISKTGQ